MTSLGIHHWRSVGERYKLTYSLLAKSQEGHGGVSESGVKRDPAFARRLRTAMEEAGIRPGALARAEGVVPQTVTKWRNGEKPDDLRLPALAARLGVTHKWLKTGEEPKHPEMVGSRHVKESGPAYEASSVHAALELMAQSLAGLSAAIRLLEGQPAAVESTGYVPDEPERLVSQMNPNPPEPAAPASPRARPKRA